MNPERVIQPSKIHMVSLKTLKGNIDGVPEGPDQGPIKDHKYDFTVSTGIIPEDKVVGLRLAVVIKALGKQQEELGINGSYTHEIIFKVENLDDFLDLKDNGEPPVIDRLLNATLTGIAFSTVRGIIYSRTIGTSLGEVIMPVVDPKLIIDDSASPNEAIPVAVEETIKTE